MNLARRTVLFGNLGMLAGAAIPPGARAETVAQDAALGPAIDAYIYGYPLLVMDVTRRQLTNVAEAGPTRAPMGQLRRLRSYLAADDHSVPAPNADTLYTDAWLDVSREPMVLSIPDMGDRYWMMPMLSGWTDVFQAPGTRTTGQRPQVYAVTGPGWSGGFRLASPSSRRPRARLGARPHLLHRNAGRLREGPCLAGPDRARAAQPIRKPDTIAPSTVDPGLDMGTLPREQVNRLSLPDYFDYLARLMKTNPPGPQDAPMVARMAAAGLAPGRDLTWQARRARPGRA